MLSHGVLLFPLFNVTKQYTADIVEPVVDAREEGSFLSGGKQHGSNQTLPENIPI